MFISTFATVGAFDLEGGVDREVPKKASRRHDKIGQSQSEVPTVFGCRGVSASA